MNLLAWNVIRITTLQWFPCLFILSQNQRRVYFNDLFGFDFCGVSSWKMQSRNSFIGDCSGGNYDFAPLDHDEVKPVKAMLWKLVSTQIRSGVSCTIFMSIFLCDFVCLLCQQLKQLTNAAVNALSVALACAVFELNLLIFILVLSRQHTKGDMS